MIKPKKSPTGALAATLNSSNPGRSSAQNLTSTSRSSKSTSNAIKPKVIMKSLPQKNRKKKVK